MASSHATSTLRQPPDPSPFQDFIKRTPPPPDWSILRAPSSSPARSGSPSSYGSRRSSSVYSRTVSQWVGDDASWNSADFADDPPPPLPLLQPMAYSASTPHLGRKMPPENLSQPRTYSPLIVTLSPSESAISLDATPARREPSNHGPTRNLPRIASKKPVQTISLEQAKANIRSAGAVHLLPEELRAQTLKKSRSHEPIRRDSADMFSPMLSPDIPQASTPLDKQGRKRSVAVPQTAQNGISESYLAAVTSIGRRPYNQAFKVGTGPERIMRPPVRSAAPADDAESGGMQDRGRPRQRKSRGDVRPHHAPRWKIPSEDSSPAQSNTRAEAQQYRNLASGERSTSRQHDTDSDDSVRDKMKLVPRALFQSKPPAKLPRDVHGPANPYSLSPQRMTSASGRSNNGTRRSSRSSYTSKHSLSRGPSHQRRSTSGSIPISPPSVVSPAPARPPPQQYSSETFKRVGDNTRASEFYPHVASRSTGKSKNSKSKAGGNAKHTPPLPLLLATRALGGSQVPAQQHPTRTVSLDQSAYLRRNSGSSSKPKQPLFQRLAESAAKYADLLTGPTELPERRNYDAITSATIAPGSPHLVSTEVHLPSQNHLGWSPRAKMAFDEARTSVSSRRRQFGHLQSPVVPQYTHVSTPARPLNETRVGLREPESPSGRKASIFGGLTGLPGLLDGWKDTQAEKRRVQLKQAIKVVPNDVHGAPQLKRRSTTGFM